MVGNQKTTLQKYELISGLQNARKSAPSGVRLPGTKPTVFSSIGKTYCKFSGRKIRHERGTDKKDTNLGTNRIGFSGGKQEMFNLNFAEYRFYFLS